MDRGSRGRLAPLIILALGTMSLFIVMDTIILDTLAGSSGEKIIEVYAYQWGYEPNIIRVKQGEYVRIMLYTRDVSHGLYIEGYDVGGIVILADGRPPYTEISFKADKAGTYIFRCIVICGPLHPYMTGKLIVEPNYRLHILLLVELIVALGATLYFYKVWW